jgi:hypothetical protein
LRAYEWAAVFRVPVWGDRVAAQWDATQAAARSTEEALTPSTVWVVTFCAAAVVTKMKGRRLKFWHYATRDVEQRHQATLLRDLLGNAIRPSPPLPLAVLAWSDGTVRRLAETVYEERRTPEGTLDPARLAILADALLDAGCEDEELIRHCRSEGPHVRGCWAVDLILGKS